ncbi:MAG: NAD(P)-dependent oxidoreductase [Patescibacteria group bacterium]|nr:NAD(P)-dependent oxidoreductase [Patescibacteria group bacterium]
MKSIAITGGSGLVGSRLKELLYSRFNFIDITSEKLDIREATAARDMLSSLECDAFVHLAAYTDVDGAERDPEAARLLNVEGTRNVYEPIHERGIPFVFFSTDFVFDGENPPYTEYSSRNPISVYGRTKAEAEELVEEDGCIIRISYPYRAAFEKKRDFIRTLKTHLEQGRPLSLIEDSVVTPTFIDDIAAVLSRLLTEFKPGIVHAVGASSHTPLEIGHAIADKFGYDSSLISPTSYKAYFAGKAQRPRRSRILPSLGFATGMRTLDEGLNALMVHPDAKEL